MLRARSQRANQKPSRPGLISDDNPGDPVPGLGGFDVPTMQQLEQCLLIGIELLQGLAFDARNNGRDEPL